MSGENLPEDDFGPDGGSGNDALRRILFRARPDIVTRTLVRALADTHPEYRVDLVSQITGAESGVTMVVFHADQQTDVAATARRVRQLHRDATLVVLIAGPMQVPPDVDQLVTRGVLQGVVPMSLSLSMWLAAFGLLLAGGLYLPAEMMTGASFRGANHGAEPVWQLAGDALDAAELTQRERDVLRLLSLGLQNKIIAAQMKLSEHTVKVHVHNIIRKLRVHNRTQAAAQWLASHGQRDDSPLL